MKTINACIIGASGYTGAELIRLLYRHDNVRIAGLVADRNAGSDIGTIYTHLRNTGLAGVVRLNEVDMSNIDVVFCCLPHGTTQEVIKNLPGNVRVIDLSADFRLHDVMLYEKWYGHAHMAPDLQVQVVYGLSEINAEAIRQARIVANPGCYPTSAALPLVPLLRHSAISIEDIIIDAKSGVTGAGRAEKQSNLFCEINEGMRAYSICNHRHIPEIEQTLSIAAGGAVQVHFTPQLVPMNRGILSTIYVKPAGNSNIDEITRILQEAYSDTPFVHVLQPGHLPATRDVYGTNACLIGIAAGRTKDRVVIVSVIDNLCKGAAGQAVQNMNLMYGFPETTGLAGLPLFP